MGDDNPGLATGVLLLLFGVWVVSRTLVHDAQGFNLVDRIVALAGGGTPSKGFKTSSQGSGLGQDLQRLLLPVSPSGGQGVPGIDFSGTPPPGYHVVPAGAPHDLVIAGPGGKGIPVARDTPTARAPVTPRAPVGTP